MRIVLSRKGFDSQYGGGPSPIVDGRRIVSLPIKYDKEEVRRYDHISLQDGNLGVLIESLYPKIRRSSHCHLDPDLRYESIPRDKGWRPLFGQVDQSASHLIDAGIEQGDIFLFFGLFRESEGWQRFRPGALKRHVIWGWLQVDEIIQNPVSWSRKNKWASSHPHTYGNWWSGRNILFVGKPTLQVDGKSTTVPGAGVFQRFDQRLCLSNPDSESPTHWRLPTFLKPDRDAGRTMSYLEKGTWTESECGRFTFLNPGYIRKWQEAVISGNPAAADWAIGLIRELAV